MMPSLTAAERLEAFLVAYDAWIIGGCPVEYRQPDGRMKQNPTASEWEKTRNALTKAAADETGCNGGGNALVQFGEAV